MAMANSQDLYQSQKSSKAVVASKALLNSIINKEPTIDFRDIHIPYVIVMGFELHLCSLSFARAKTYVTRKLKSVSFPSSINRLSQEIQGLTNGLLCLLVRKKGVLFYLDICH